MQDKPRSLWPLVAVAAIFAIAGVAVAFIIEGHGSASSSPATVALAAQSQSRSRTTRRSSRPKVVDQTTTVIQQTKSVTQAAAAAPASAPAATPSGLAACDQNISVNGSTSCPFADNVFNQYAIAVQETGTGSYDVSAYSPATGQTYTDDCQLNSQTQIVDCSHGGDLVQFPEWAAGAYQTH